MQRHFRLWFFYQHWNQMEYRTSFRIGQLARDFVMEPQQVVHSLKSFIGILWIACRFNLSLQGNIQVYFIDLSAGLNGSKEIQKLWGKLYHGWKMWDQSAQMGAKLLWGLFTKYFSHDSIKIRQTINDLDFNQEMGLTRYLSQRPGTHLDTLQISFNSSH